MTEESSIDSQLAFGETNPIAFEGRAGARGGGFHWLLDDADRDRGFFTENDRRFLLTANWGDEVSYQTERNARLRIRNRVLSTFFDSRYLKYISDKDRELIFENARDEGYDLHFREGFKELVRFTYLGLHDFDIDAEQLLETAIREAERDHAIAAGENATFEVEIQVTRHDGDGIETLLRRFENRDYLHRSELTVLVNSPETDIDLADAIYYNARQPDTDRHGYSWEDPDVEEAEEIVAWIRSVFEEYNIETYEEYNVAVDRLTALDDENVAVIDDISADELLSKVNRLRRCAPNFDEQLATEAGLPTSDMALLQDILWNPKNIDVETALEEEVRPRTAGDSWDPSEDENLQKFIARVQVARELAEFFTSGGEEGTERWNKVLHLAEFNAEEWAEYMQELRIERCKDAIESLLESTDELSRKDLTELLNEMDDVPESELADFDELQENMELSDSEIDDMKKLDKFWNLLPDDADTKDLEHIAHFSGDKIVLETLSDIQEKDV